MKAKQLMKAKGVKKKKNRDREKTSKFTNKQTKTTVNHGDHVSESVYFCFLNGCVPKNNPSVYIGRLLTSR